MKTIIFERNEPSGDVILNLPEFNINKLLHYITNKTFHVDGVYESYISEIEEIEDEDKFLVVVNDNSNHGYIKRCYIYLYSENELKSL